MEPTARDQPGEAPSHDGRLKRLHSRLHANPVTGLVTKIVVTFVGVGVLGAGLVMMVTPGPGIVGIILGLAILATEWDWAEHWMHQTKEKAREAADRARDMDPVVRRRRLLLTALGVVALVAVVWWYVAANDWPLWATTSWSWLQDKTGFLPPLPGAVDRL